MPDQDPQDATALCCSQFYEQDVVRELMGDSFHPGGVDLSKRLIQMCGLRPGSRVVDVACGVGTTARLLAHEFGFQTTGIDFSQANVDKASAMDERGSATIDATSGTTANGSMPDLPDAAACCSPGDPCCDPVRETTLPNPKIKPVDGTTPVAGQLNFQQGSATNLPIASETVDGVFCECAVSTFDDQPSAAKEFYRVLKTGGTFAMSDMVVNGELPSEIAENIAPWTCVANAHSIQGYQQIFLDHGFVVAHQADESNGLLDLVSQLKRKLLMAGFGKTLGALPGLQLDISQVRSMLAEAKTLIENGTVQYASFVFEKK